MSDDEGLVRYFTPDNQPDFAYVEKEEPLFFEVIWSPHQLIFIKETEADLQDFARNISVNTGFDSEILINLNGKGPESISVPAETISNDEERKGINSGPLRINYENIDAALHMEEGESAIDEMRWYLRDLGPVNQTESILRYDMNEWSREELMSRYTGQDELDNGRYAEILVELEEEMRSLLEDNGYSETVFNH